MALNVIIFYSGKNAKLPELSFFSWKCLGRLMCLYLTCIFLHTVKKVSKLFYRICHPTAPIKKVWKGLLFCLLWLHYDYGFQWRYRLQYLWKIFANPLSPCVHVASGVEKMWVQQMQSVVGSAGNISYITSDYIVKLENITLKIFNL